MPAEACGTLTCVNNFFPYVGFLTDEQARFSIIRIN